MMGPGIHVQFAVGALLCISASILCTDFHPGAGKCPYSSEYGCGSSSSEPHYSDRDGDFESDRSNPYREPFRQDSPAQDKDDHRYEARPNDHESSTHGYGPSSNPALKPQHTCPIKTYGPCPRSRYRTIDGSCNNLRNPGSGTANTPYGRLLPSTYADGDHLPTISRSGKQLPGARVLSTTLFPDNPISDPEWSLIAMSWGQMLSHDMSLALGTISANAPNCCSTRPQKKIPFPCFPIDIPLDDPFYAKYKQSCMNFTRTTTDVQLGCGYTNGRAQEQLVAVTHWMDASHVYGSTLQIANSLRTGIGGRLRVDVRHGRQWLPTAGNNSFLCDVRGDKQPCYKCGDIRCNQNPQLAILHIILLREHNRIADILGYINPHWDDEIIYQEARRILIAEYQHINYHEWLPIFLGSENVFLYDLAYKTDRYVNDYREEVEPNVLNEHATAAFRYFHTAAQGRLELISENRRIERTVRLSDHLRKPAIIEQGKNMDKLARGMTTQSQENVDQYLTSEITDLLFKSGRPFGIDLRSFDIQRGRDHALASYNSVRHACGYPKARKFEDFADWISSENIKKLARLYAHPDEVDLMIGGSLEAHVKGTLTGPTFLCVMLEQFTRTRVSDRFFYETGDHDVAFTPAQLKEIRKSSVSRLLCDNSDGIEYMQPEGFRIIGDENQLVSCSNTRAIPAIDLSLWEDRSTGKGYGGHAGFPEYDSDGNDYRKN